MVDDDEGLQAVALVAELDHPHAVSLMMAYTAMPADLVISELVSNALEHGRGQVVFRLQLDERIVHGEVIDEGGGFEHEIRARGPDDVGGRGLFLVEALTNRWGIHEGTTHVWFELAAQTDASGPPRPRLGQGERPEALD